MKAHLLCARPLAVLEVHEDMMSYGIPSVPRTVDSYCQSLLIVCHSTLLDEHFNRLGQALSAGDHVMAAASISHKRNWSEMKHIATQLHQSPRSVSLRDLLIGFNAQRSPLFSWENCIAGRRYLDSGHTSS